MAVVGAKRGAEEVDWVRCGWIFAIVVFGLGVAGLGAWAILDRTAFDDWFPPVFDDLLYQTIEGFVEELVPLVGLLALGSTGAFLTAWISAMQRVKYDPKRSSGKRFLLCVSRTSRLETLLRILIGIAVGFGAYLLARLTGAC